MTDAPRSALVVMRPGRDTLPTSARPSETPTHASDAARVVSWFQDHGFDTGPVLGISFAITGAAELFRDVLGAPASGASGDTAFATEALDPELSDLVEAIVVQAPADFGPGNP
ncbi:hypothetical protein [Nocardioides caldifontis]|uniref:hypothetical protein n=1 Tax=Nocardioides caldifontis TaxID=2588938 RepID=UPI0011DF51FA|nr:hypothetical protein [Nocardioides caldifontis]